MYNWKPDGPKIYVIYYSLWYKPQIQFVSRLYSSQDSAPQATEMFISKALKNGFNL